MASSIRNLFPRSISSKRTKTPKFTDSENTPPPDPNVTKFSDPPLSPSLPKKLPRDPPLVGQVEKSDGQETTSEASDPAVKGHLPESNGQETASETLDPAVKVVARIRGVNDEVSVSVRKVSSDSLCVGDRKFGFDSVLDSKSSQDDVFRLVGIPVVKSALAGYNASVLSYGQTASGKTYTMWGPPSAMLEDPSPGGERGIVPRIFQMLFSEIQREQDNSEGKQINYQCRCSFLEIYNEQIGDLLDPMQRNLEIRDDPKNGLYVENLTEEYVNSYEDVTQILIKGLSSRKVGATSLNSKSSRSHVVFSFIIESWCKGASSKCFSSSKISKINLVDLAGLDRNRVDDAGRQFVKESKSVKMSLSQLGKLVKNLAEGSQLESNKDLTYKRSCLTHLLRESLGGNAKLTVICNVSANHRNNGETLRTLRFGQRVKFIKNYPVINEISEDDVNDLSDQIRLLKEELIRAKSDVSKSVGSKNGYFNGRNVRDSLNHLRVSLNRSLLLTRVDNDSDNELDVDETDVRELHQHLDKLRRCSSEENLREESTHFTSVEESLESDLMSEDEVNGPEEIGEEISCAEAEDIVRSDCNMRTSITISISPHHQSEVLQEPILSESPKIAKTRKSISTLSKFSASQKNLSESSHLKSDTLLHSPRQSEHIRASLRSSKLFPGPAESLAASLQKGLQIIDHHQQNSVSNRSSVAFSFEHLALQPCPGVDTADDSIEKLANERPSLEGPSASLLCATCKQKLDANSNEVQDSLKTWIVAAGVNPNQIREKELESICTEQAAKIEQLNQLVEQYKREIQNNQESHKLCLEGVKNQIIPFEESKRKDSLRDEDKSRDIAEEKCEIKEVQEEILDLGNKTLDVNEKEELLKEIQTLKTKLQSYTDASSNRSTEKLRSSLLAQSLQLRKSMDTRYSNAEELEKERQRWTEMESDWISLTDDLRIDIETQRQRAEKVEMELMLEKKCTEELDDALGRAVLGHARMVEHYTELQEKYNDLVGKHRAVMEGVAEVKKAAAKAGTKSGTRFAKAVAAELSTVRMEREREREYLKKENKSLKIQLRDTAEAVQAAGELLVRLKEAEQAAAAAEENCASLQQENEKLKKQAEKIKRKHKMEMITMKQYLAESRLPESALQPLYRDNSDVAAQNTLQDDDDQAWRAEFGAIYQEHF